MSVIKLAHEGANTIGKTPRAHAQGHEECVRYECGLERELKDALSLNWNANWYAHKKARRLRAGWMCEVIAA
jgi:hypothetical protein